MKSIIFWNKETKKEKKRKKRLKGDLKRLCIEHLLETFQRELRSMTSFYASWTTHTHWLRLRKLQQTIINNKRFNSTYK